METTSKSLEKILLLCTVGGRPEPVGHSLAHWKPDRVLFLCSEQSKDEVASDVLPLALAKGFSINVGQFDLVNLGRAEDFEELVAGVAGTSQVVEKWLARGSGFIVLADITGGTKLMSAALALVAHRWPCGFSYVGGAERDRGGLGTVVSGSEQIVHRPNPWNALGHLVAEDATVLFNHGNFAAAVRLLEDARNRMEDPAHKRELNTFVSLCQLCEKWDRFQHRASLDQIKSIRSGWNDMKALFGEARCVALKQWIDGAEDALLRLSEREMSPAARSALVNDLLSNAHRRIAQGAFDDAVARLYRAIEAIAQSQLASVHGLDNTGAVALDRLPNALRVEWEPRASEGMVALGLHDDYRLLKALGDDLGSVFENVGLADQKKSPLVARNQSILAHGYQPVSETIAGQLLTAALSLSGINTNALIGFPKL